MYIKVPTKNIIINLDEVTHVYIGDVKSDEVDIVFAFKNGKTLISTTHTQRKPRYKKAFDIAQETIEELAKAIEKASEQE